jgi:uncharacterized membrane protein HdeD (DUF308 family)
MISVLGQQLWKNKLAARGWHVVLGVMSVVAGSVVLVWPFDSLVVLTFVAGAALGIPVIIPTAQAFQIRRDTKAAYEAFEALSERVPA